MAARIAFWFVCASASLAAYGADLILEFAPAQAVTVLRYGPVNDERTVLPGSDTHRKLMSWMANNHSGWSRFHGTPQRKGIFVLAKGLIVQFVDSSVLAYQRDGTYIKDMVVSEYSFLDE